MTEMFDCFSSDMVIHAYQRDLCVMVKLILMKLLSHVDLTKKMLGLMWDFEKTEIVN